MLYLALVTILIDNFKHWSVYRTRAAANSILGLSTSGAVAEKHNIFPKHIQETIYRLLQPTAHGWNASSLV